VDCHTSMLPQSVIKLLTGLIPSVPFPATFEGDETALAAIRRGITAQRRGMENFIESNWPNVFQLHPRSWRASA